MCLQNYHDRIEILEVKLKTLDLLINKVEEIEKTTTVHQQQIEELKVPEVVVVENDISTFNKHRFIQYFVSIKEFWHFS